MAMATIYKVTEDSPGGPVVARFVYSTDAVTFCEQATLEKGRVLWLQDRQGYWNHRYENGYNPQLAGIGKE